MTTTRTRARTAIHSTANAGVSVFKKILMLMFLAAVIGGLVATGAVIGLAHAFN